MLRSSLLVAVAAALLLATGALHFTCKKMDGGMSTACACPSKPLCSGSAAFIDGYQKPCSAPPSAGASALCSKGCDKCDRKTGR